MVSNCSLHRLKPVDPGIDPAYEDGPAPPPRRVSHAGEITIDWPFARLPRGLWSRGTISIETLEDELEREARREERWQ
jgi:hypothetical protein